MAMLNNQRVREGAAPKKQQQMAVVFAGAILFLNMIETYVVVFMFMNFMTHDY